MRANCTQVEKLQIKNVNKNKSVKHYYMERNADEKTKERFNHKPYESKKWMVINN